jgi:hypothetical protein
MNHWLQTLSMMTTFGCDFEAGELKQILGAQVVIAGWQLVIRNRYYQMCTTRPVVRSIERG